MTHVSLPGKTTGEEIIQVINSFCDLQWTTCAGGTAAVTGSVKGLFGHVCMHCFVHNDPFHPILVIESQTVTDAHLATTDAANPNQVEEVEKSLVTTVSMLPPELSKLMKVKEAQDD